MKRAGTVTRDLPSPAGNYLHWARAIHAEVLIALDANTRQGTLGRFARRRFGKQVGRRPSRNARRGRQPGLRLERQRNIGVRQHLRRESHLAKKPDARWAGKFRAGVTRSRFWWTATTSSARRADRKGAIAALDKKTGEVVWRSTEFTDGAQYSSLVPAKINGTPQYVQLTMESIVGVNARDGKVLWKSPFPGKTAVIPTPIVRDNLVYVTAGYGVGCKQIKIGANNEVTTVYENKVMKNHHGGVILVGDHIYGHADAGWTCQDFKTGEEVWNHRGFGKGAVAYADGMLYCIDEGSGQVALVEASPKGWQEHGRFKLDPQTKIRSPQGRIWTHPVISNGKLYLRDQDLIFCYDIKKS